MDTCRLKDVMVSWMTLWLASEHVGRSFAHEREGIIDGGLSDAEVREYITKVAAPESPLAQRVAMLPKRNLILKKKHHFFSCEVKTVLSTIVIGTFPE